MTKPSLVSVVIPCYNDKNHLPRAVDSVLNQKTPGTEIIIVDDQSTDESFQVAQELAGRFPEIVALQQPANGGPAKARNAGLRAAVGRFVCFLDADDEYAPDFFSTTIPLLQEDSELAWVATDIELINLHRDIHPVQVEAIVRSLPSNILVRKVAAELLGGFPEGQAFRGKSAGEDILFRNALRHWFKGVDRPEKCLRYWVKRESHFDTFLDSSRVEGNKLIFANPETPFVNDELSEAAKCFVEEARERLSIVATVKRFDESFPPLFRRLFKAITTFDELRSKFDAIEGAIHHQEGSALYHFARFDMGKGVVVEIGSQFGRSTCWLAAGTRDAEREKVIAVNSNRNLMGSKKANPNGAASAQKDSALSTFLDNLQKHGLRNWVDPRIGDPVDICSKWQGPIRLLLIEGDHSYEGTKQDVETWGKHVVSGGLMAFRDIHVSPGVTDFYRDLLAAKLFWKEVCKVRSLRIVRRMSGQKMI
jgi:glycosyltransferase involved in cell wall biosynthesis/predicted O-methyltransferase YrrM